MATNSLIAQKTPKTTGLAMRPYVVAGLQSVSLPFQSPLKSDYCSRKDQTLSKDRMNLKVTLLEEGKNNNSEGAVGLACTPMTARQAKYLGGNRQKPSVCGMSQKYIISSKTDL